MAQQKEIEGVLHLSYEAGTEGSDWALQDKRFIFPPIPPWPHEIWSYNGLHILKDGDHLTIFDKQDPQKMVWYGVIQLRQYELFTEHVSTGTWIHADQEGVERSVWEKFFLGGYPAKLTR